MTTLEETFFDLHDANAAAAKLQEECSAVGGRREGLYWQMKELRKGYGKDLRKAVQRRASRIVRKHSHAWCVDVRVVPLHNHTTHETLPLIEIKWATKGVELRMHTVPMVPCLLEQFLDRFEHVVKASQLHRCDSPHSGDHAQSPQDAPFPGKGES